TTCYAPPHAAATNAVAISIIVSSVEHQRIAEQSKACQRAASSVSLSLSQRIERTDASRTTATIVSHSVKKKHGKSVHETVRVAENVQNDDDRVSGKSTTIGRHYRFCDSVSAHCSREHRHHHHHDHHHHDHHHHHHYHHHHHHEHHHHHHHNNDDDHATRDTRHANNLQRREFAGMM
ncbi:hypothetical protein Tcan_00765, partial [Toxocara canis]